MLLGRKVITSLDSIFKSRDLTLPTKVHLVKAVVFPVVTHRCENWTIKKASAEELMLSNCGVGKDSDAERDWGQEEKGTAKDEMAGWHH